MPDGARLRGRVETGIGRIGHLLQAIHQLLSQAARMLRIVRTKFNQHNAAPLWQQFEFRRSLGPQPVHDAALETFEADGLKGQDLRNVIGRDKSVAITDSDQRPMLRAGDELHLGFEHGHAGALRSHQCTSQVESFR